MKRITLEALLRDSGLWDEEYETQCAGVLAMLEEKKIKPVKRAGTNGKRPALWREYWVAKEEAGAEDWTEELSYKLSPLIYPDYYLAHPAQYVEDREMVLALSDYLTGKRAFLSQAESVNERSFEIWNREKFLSKESGRTLLKRCGLSLDFFHVYQTAEPFSYFVQNRNTPQNLLIVENKDTFYSMRRHLLAGNLEILGMETGTLIYGAGKRILRSFADFELGAEPYMEAAENRFFYFGDLDYEGILIYESLAKEQMEKRRIIPFAAAYEAMLRKVLEVKALPATKERQNRNIDSLFFSFFPEETAVKMRDILEGGRYIPQEILNAADF